MNQPREKGRAYRRQFDGSFDRFIHFAFTAATIAGLLIPALAQTDPQLGVTICACSPSTYEFALDFNQTCANNTIIGDGVINQECTIAPFQNQSVIDLVPTEVQSIDILELDESLVLITQSSRFGKFQNGDTFSYVSISSDPALINVSTVPKALQISMLGTNVNGDTLFFAGLIIYDTNCTTFPTVEPGTDVGWVSLKNTSDPSSQICPLAPSADTNANATTTSAPNITSPPISNQSAVPDATTQAPSLESSLVPDTVPSNSSEMMRPIPLPCASSSKGKGKSKSKGKKGKKGIGKELHLLFPDLFVNISGCSSTKIGSSKKSKSSKKGKKSSKYSRSDDYYEDWYPTNHSTYNETSIPIHPPSFAPIPTSTSSMQPTTGNNATSGPTIAPTNNPLVALNASNRNADFTLSSSSQADVYADKAQESKNIKAALAVGGLICTLAVTVFTRHQYIHQKKIRTEKALNIMKGLTR